MYFKYPSLPTVFIIAHNFILQNYREVDVACIKETRWRGSGCRFFGPKSIRYNLFWQGQI